MFSALVLFRFETMFFTIIVGDLRHIFFSTAESFGSEALEMTALAACTLELTSRFDAALNSGKCDWAVTDLMLS